MQQFIPFEDDWDALANLRLEDLVPYRVGMLKDRRAAPDAIPPKRPQAALSEHAPRRGLQVQVER